MKKWLREGLVKVLKDQRAWIAERGDSLAGYLAFYPTRTPDNVKAIYEADVAELRRLEKLVA